MDVTPSLVSAAKNPQQIFACLLRIREQRLEKSDNNKSSTASLKVILVKKNSAGISKRSLAFFRWKIR